mmetsp:Transcript_19590/g.42815  ORF Transcript_19590/g.42815 Transcript_19590/m.42815 type:complete len:105 (+) Transcript_19590:117-431(+)
MKLHHLGGVCSGRNQHKNVQPFTLRNGIQELRRIQGNAIDFNDAKTWLNPRLPLYVCPRLIPVVDEPLLYLEDTQTQAALSIHIQADLALRFCLHQLNLKHIIL